MTTAIFLLAFFALFVAILNFLPVMGAVTPQFITAIATMVGYMKAWNDLFPITELFICVAIVVVYEISVWVFHVLWGTAKLTRGGTS